MSDIFVRNAKSTDNFLEIASCIYLTDPFIYPAAFGSDANRAAHAISKLMFVENGLFSPDNLAIALCGAEISGALLYNKSGAIWDHSECAALVKDSVPNIQNFEYVSNSYFAVESVAPAKNNIEVVAFCVMPEFRNIGIGQLMLDWLIKKYPESDFTLDVLANNDAAVRLYKKCGFKVIEEFKGFSLEEATRPDCYKMIKYSQWPKEIVCK